MTKRIKPNAARIISGAAKNKRLLVGEFSRAVTGRIKQTIFDLLGKNVIEANVLDLFAGSGSFGLEALSRGSRRAVFVDQEFAAREILNKNIINCNFTTQSEIHIRDVVKFIRQTNDKFDLIFADPPFPTADEFPVHLLLKVSLPSTLIVLRLPLSVELKKPESIKLIYEKKLGRSKVYFLQT